MEVLYIGVKFFIFLLLPVGGGRVAKEDAASEGANGMDAAEPANLEWAAGMIPCGVFRQMRIIPQGGIEGGHFGGGDIEPVAVTFELTTLSGSDTEGLAAIDGFLKVQIQFGYGRDDLWPVGCGSDGGGKWVVGLVHPFILATGRGAGR